jgi:hypothetical protein
VRGKRERARERPQRRKESREREKREDVRVLLRKKLKNWSRKWHTKPKNHSLSRFSSPSHNEIKKNKHTSKGKNSISPPPLQKFIYTHRIKKTAYIKNGFYCASEKSLLVSHFLVRCDRIERSRVFARGGFPIGFFLLSFFTRRDGLELSLPA